MNKNSTWNDIVKPVVVLTVICAVTAGLLGLTQSFTQPIIDENARKVAEQARIELLPEAESFTQIEVEMANVLELYASDNNVGHTISSQGQGYGGMVKMMIALDTDGNISNIKVLEMMETPGIGDKIYDPDFLNQFVGKNEEFTTSNIDVISGTTISSNAVISAMNSALTAYNATVKGEVIVEKTLEQKLGELYGEGSSEAVLSTDYSHADAKEFYTTDTGIIIAVEQPGYEDGMVTTYVAFNEDKTVVGIHIDTSTQTPGIGTKVEDDSFTQNFVGITSVDGIDVIANVTFTSDAVIDAVEIALAIIATI